MNIRCKLTLTNYSNTMYIFLQRTNSTFVQSAKPWPLFTQWNRLKILYFIYEIARKFISKRVWIADSQWINCTKQNVILRAVLFMYLMNAFWVIYDSDMITSLFWLRITSYKFWHKLIFLWPMSFNASKHLYLCVKRLWGLKCIGFRQ